MSKFEEDSSYSYKILRKFGFLSVPYGDFAKKFSIDELAEVLDQLFEDSQKSLGYEFSLKIFLFFIKVDDIVLVLYDDFVVFVKILNNNAINVSQNAQFLLNESNIGFVRSVEILGKFHTKDLDFTLRNFLNNNNNDGIIEINDDKILDSIIKTIL